MGGLKTEGPLYTMYRYIYICYSLLYGFAFMAVTEACRKEEAKLADENAILKKEVEQLKKDLVAAEIKNGGKCHCVIIHNST